MLFFCLVPDLRDGASAETDWLARQKTAAEVAEQYIQSVWVHELHPSVKQWKNCGCCHGCLLASYLNSQKNKHKTQMKQQEVDRQLLPRQLALNIKHGSL